METVSDFKALQDKYNELLAENTLLRQKYELGTNEFVLIGLSDFQVTYIQDNPDTFDTERKYMITDFYTNHVKTDSRRIPLSAFPNVEILDENVDSDTAPELVEPINE